MKKKEWSIILLVQTKDTHALHVKNLFEDIAASGYNKKINLQICLNTTKGSITTIDPSINVDDIPSDTGEAPRLFTFFYEFIPGKLINKEARLICIDKDYTIDFSLEEDVLRCMRAMVDKKNAKKTLVMTWDHGTGLGLFKKIREGTDGSVYKKGYTILLADHVDKIFKQVYKGKKVDILLMMNCFMNFIDFGMSIRNSVKYLVAPPNFIHFTGYNYREIFTTIFKYPCITGKGLAKKIVQYQKEIVPAPNSRYRDILRQLIEKNEAELILSANSLVFYKEMADILDKVIEILTQLIEDKSLLKDDLVKTCQAAVNMEGTTFDQVDFYSVLTNIKSITQHKELHSLINNIFSCLKKIALKKYHGTEIRKRLPEGFRKRASISIYFPLAKFLNQVSKEPGAYQDFIVETSEYATVFSKNHRWDNFLLLFLQDGRVERPEFISLT